MQSINIKNDIIVPEQVALRSVQAQLPKTLSMSYTHRDSLSRHQRTFEGLSSGFFHSSLGWVSFEEEVVQEIRSSFVMRPEDYIEWGGALKKEAIEKAQREEEKARKLAQEKEDEEKARLKAQQEADNLLIAELSGSVIPGSSKKAAKGKKNNKKNDKKGDKKSVPVKTETACKVVEVVHPVVEVVEVVHPVVEVVEVVQPVVEVVEVVHPVVESLKLSTEDQAILDKLLTEDYQYDCRYEKELAWAIFSNEELLRRILDVFYYENSGKRIGIAATLPNGDIVDMCFDLDGICKPYSYTKYTAKEWDEYYNPPDISDEHTENIKYVTYTDKEILENPSLDPERAERMAKVSGASFGKFVKKRLHHKSGKGNAKQKSRNVERLDNLDDDERMIMKGEKKPAVTPLEKIPGMRYYDKDGYSMSWKDWCKEFENKTYPVRL